ncbi:hypothetical protein N0V90_005902 [Kalmusia sp. IMI 367209]|nr:hypothetical protein N0V90_005902 [Kalmusia sp. IMI 367209]
MDFSEYGHPSQEWLDFIFEDPDANQDGRSGNETQNASELSKKANEMRRASSLTSMQRAGLADKVHISTIQAPSRGAHTIPIRRYKATMTSASSTQTAIIYLHGGGWLFGDEQTDDFVCAKIAAETGTLVLSIIYRHTDKYKHPAQVDDAWDAFEHIRVNKQHVGLPPSGDLVAVGISAGAGLAAGIVLRDLERCAADPRQSPLISGILLSMPWLIHPDNYPDHLFKNSSVSAKVQCADTPVIPAERMRMFCDLLGADSISDRLLNIALMSEDLLQNWPRTAIIVTGMDPLRDDGLIFAKRLQSAGVLTKHSSIIMFIISPLSRCASPEKADRVTLPLSKLVRNALANKPSRSSKFLQYVSDIAHVTEDTEAQVLAYAWFRAASDNNEIPVHYLRGFEVYETIAANQITHRASTPYKAFRHAVAQEGLLERPSDLRFWRPTGIGFLTKTGPLACSASSEEEFVVIYEISPKYAQKENVLQRLRTVAQRAGGDGSALSFWVLDRGGEGDGNGVYVGE